MPHVEPGGALELAPAATDGATVRWRQFEIGTTDLTPRITAPLPIEF